MVCSSSVTKTKALLGSGLLRFSESPFASGGVFSPVTATMSGESMLLQLPWLHPSSWPECVASLNEINQSDCRWHNGFHQIWLADDAIRKWRLKASHPPAEVTLYHLKWARSALRDLWHSVWGSEGKHILTFIYWQYRGSIYTMPVKCK